MTRSEAVIDLLRDARQERSTAASCRRVMRACKVLGMDDADTLRVLQHLEYARDDGKPWGKDMPQLWRIPELV